MRGICSFDGSMHKGHWKPIHAKKNRLIRKRLNGRPYKLSGRDNEDSARESKTCNLLAFVLAKSYQIASLEVSNGVAPVKISSFFCSLTYDKIIET